MTSRASDRPRVPLMKNHEAHPKPGEMLLPSRNRVLPRDGALFRRLLGSFVPPGVFDVHAHLYPLAATGFTYDGVDAGANVDLATYFRETSAWMGDRAPADGLFFGIPSSPNVDVVASNRFVADQVATRAASRALMLIRPGDDPNAVEAEVRDRQFVGFKVYHTLAAGPDTANADLDAYLPQWAWEIAHRRGLVIMLHLVKPRALADESNQRALRTNLKRWGGARVILAHGARGFCAQHTVEGIGTLAGFENVFFDTSAICESPALLAILQKFGPSRLMYGSDFPVSNFRGRVVSVGDGFAWLLEHNVDFGPPGDGSPTLVGIESLLALKQAARLIRLTDAEVESIFCSNAGHLLGVMRNAPAQESDTRKRGLTTREHHGA